MPQKFIISGGGTGGHIYPAIAIANEIKARDKSAEILFVGAKDRMEMQKVPKAGYEIKGLWISGIQRKLTVDNLSFPLKLLSSLREAKKIIKEFQPNIAIGVGGYASGPLLYQAASMKIPSLIQEQNSFAGLTNKWLAKKVNKICVAYDGMETFFPKEKIIFTGNPVRSDILELKNKKEEALKFFNLNPDKKTIFVMGGSLGARTINQSVGKDLQKLVDADTQLIWQTGKLYFEDSKKITEPFQDKGIRVFDFIYKMDLAYAAADLVVSRAGALSVAELCLVGKPTVLVPSPNVAEDHQTKNALSLVKEDAALMVKDSEAPDVLVLKAIELLQNQELCKKLDSNILNLGKPNATQEIVDEVLNLIK